MTVKNRYRLKSFRRLIFFSKQPAMSKDREDKSHDGIDPRYPMKDATEEDLGRLYESTVRIMRKMCEEGGRNVVSARLFWRRPQENSKNCLNSM